MTATLIHSYSEHVLFDWTLAKGTCVLQQTCPPNYYGHACINFLTKVTTQKPETRTSAAKM